MTSPRKIQLSTTPTPEALAELKLGEPVIQVGYCHTGGLPMSVHAFCLSSRRAVARIWADGRFEHRTDPDWFPPYQRRETVGWDEMQVAAE